MPGREFRYSRRVQFAETDLVGVVHFSWYFRYMEEAEHALWREAGLCVVPEDSDVRFPRVSASIDFHAPLRFEDVFEVHVRIESMTQRSIRYTHTITCDGTVAATGSMTAVCVRTRPEMQAIDIPEHIARRFAPWADPTTP
ncbi:MAG TPA: thioesterase family protein [Vicinamibacterales bacterium]|nr:thioesterase family protein [Vicinamibacterales bacterium]